MQGAGRSRGMTAAGQVPGRSQSSLNAGFTAMADLGAEHSPAPGSCLNRVVRKVLVFPPTPDSHSIPTPDSMSRAAAPHPPRNSIDECPSREAQ